MSEWVFLCVIVSLLLSLLAIIVGVILYSGLLSEIIIRTGSPPIKNITFAYKFKEEPYKNYGQLFTECCSIGPKLSCVGVFYDDLKKAQGQRCRYAVGSILSEGATKPCMELLQLYEKCGFNVFSFPEVTHVVTTSFPHRTLLSILLGVRRVYPRLDNYIKERKLCAHPFLEIYRGGQIQYMAPLARQGDFYVPEVRQVERRLSRGEESGSETELSGSDSASEYSSGSGVMLSDSRETSPALSSVQLGLCHDRGHDGDGGYRGESATESSIKVLDWELTREQQAEREEQAHGTSNQKNFITKKGGIVAGGEE